MTSDIPRLKEQKFPSETRCPYCGSPPSEDSGVLHKLSHLGYLHDDIEMDCSNEACGHRWQCGVPIGSDDSAEEELFCSSCSSRFGLVHRISLHGDMFHIQLKCPNKECHYVWYIDRKIYDGMTLVGYPVITGYRETAETYDYQVKEDE